MTPKAGDHSWEKQVELIILLFSISSPFWLTWTQCEICPGEGEGGGGSGEGGGINSFLPMKIQRREVRTDPGAASPGCLCCEKLAERSSLPRGEPSDLRLAPLQGVPAPTCPPASPPSSSRGFPQHPPSLPLSLPPRRPPPARLQPHPSPCQGKRRLGARAGLCGRGRSVRAACALFARPRSDAVGPGSRTEMGKGGFGEQDPPGHPSGSQPRRCLRAGSVSALFALKIASGLRVPALSCAAPGWSPGQFLSFLSTEPVAWEKQELELSRSRSAEPGGCSPQKPLPFPRGLSTFCPQGFFGDGEAALLLGGSVPWEGWWGTLGCGPRRASRPTRTPRGTNPTQSAGFAPFTLLPSAPGHCPAENRGSAVPFPPHSASCRGDKDLALSLPCRTPPGPRLGGAHEAGRGLGWLPRRGGRCRASARSREGPEGFVLPGPRAGPGDRRELRRAPGMLWGGRRSWGDPPAEGDISPRPGTSRTNTAAT